jgi:hypothetical protein
VSIPDQVNDCRADDWVTDVSSTLFGWKQETINRRPVQRETQLSRPAVRWA